MRSSVVLPEPEGPSSASSSPAPIQRYAVQRRRIVEALATFSIGRSTGAPISERGDRRNVAEGVHVGPHAAIAAISSA